MKYYVYTFLDKERGSVNLLRCESFFTSECVYELYDEKENTIGSVPTWNTIITTHEIRGL